MSYTNGRPPAWQLTLNLVAYSLIMKFDSYICFILVHVLNLALHTYGLERFMLYRRASTFEGLSLDEAEVSKASCVARFVGGSYRPILLVCSHFYSKCFHR